MKQGFRLSSLILACLLSACGGGGSGGGGTSSGGGGNSISLDRDALVFVQDVPTSSGVSPTATADVTVTFRGAGVVVGTLPGQSYPEWLTVTAPTTSASPLKLKFEGHSAFPGRYQTTMRILTGNTDQTGVVSKDLPVSLIVMPKLPSDIVLDSVAGGPTSKTAISMNAGSALLTLASSAAWLKLDAATVTGSGLVVATADPAGVPPGVHTAKITVEEGNSHTKKVINATLRVDTPRLVLRERAVAFSLVGSMSYLQRNIPIGDNGKAGVQWSAQADKSWLKLGQQTGVSGASLALSADAAGLADGMHYATVTLKQVNEPAADAATMRVGVYVNRATAYSPLASATADGMSFMSGVVSDPLRPYFYHLQTDGQLFIYNMYTGALEGKVLLPTARGAWMTASSDGSRMYVLDTWKASVYPVNLDTLAVEAPISLGSGSILPNDMQIVYAELSGLPVLVSNLAHVIDARTGLTLAKSAGEGVLFNAMVVQRDGMAMYGQTWSSSHSVYRYRLSNFLGNVYISEAFEQGEPGAGRGLALDFSDTYVYSAAGQSSVGSDTTDAYRYTTTLMPAGKLPAPKGDASGIAVSSSGSILVSKWGDGSLSVYGADLAPLPGTRHGEHADDLTISGDGRRVAMYVQEAGKRKMYFVEVP